MDNPRKTVLIAPLNWGLGHANRLLPVIAALRDDDCRVMVAATSPALEVIQQEFPELEIRPIKSSAIRYTRNRWLMPKLFVQAPVLLRDLLYERRWIKRYVQNEKPDLIISDNRFGLYHKDVFSCYMTHQVKVIMPAYLKPFQPLVRWIHRKIIASYDVCLIPDGEQNGLSGKLAHQPKGFSFKHVYIGPVSGFLSLSPVPAEHIPDVLLVVSGPEPQRHMLVEKFADLFRNDSRELWIVAGQPHKKYDNRDNNIRIISHMRRAELKYLMMHVPVLILRSGYTSLMDLHAIKRKAILIPTPGQTEQEYLGWYFEQRYAFTVFQQKAKMTVSDYSKRHCGSLLHDDSQSIENIRLKLKSILR